LEKKGYLKRTDKVIEGKVRKYYRVTRDGRIYLREQKRRLVELISEALSVEELSSALERRRKREEAKRLSS
jgi:DNA-binding PadR family transcriptional regulator